MGLVRSVERIIHCNDGRVRHEKSKIKAQSTDRNGYKYVTLASRQAGVKKNLFIHQLVAKAFIGNPDNKVSVNHIDGNVTNNNVENLEWVTQLENVRHAIRIGLVTKEDQARNGKRIGEWSKQNKTKKVAKIDNGKVVQVYNSMNDIPREGTYKSIGQISQCCNNKLTTAYGYGWKFI